MSTLLDINVSQHTEKKNGLTYLSWAWAWAQVLKIDPLAEWVAHEYLHGETKVPYMTINETAMVKTTVTIKGIARACVLPVMDHRNKAIKNPDAFQVNTAIMRCMTKAISMHGLGLYIYAGEDLPESSERAPSREEVIRAAADAAIAKFNDGNEYGAYEEVCNITDTEEMLLLWNIFGKENSALRASIKKQAAEERARQAAVAQMPSAIDARKAA